MARPPPQRTEADTFEHQKDLIKQEWQSFAWREEEFSEETAFLARVVKSHRPDRKARILRCPVLLLFILMLLPLSPGPVSPHLPQADSRA